MKSIFTSAASLGLLLVVLLGCGKQSNLSHVAEVGTNLDSSGGTYSNFQ